MKRPGVAERNIHLPGLSTPTSDRFGFSAFHERCLVARHLVACAMAFSLPLSTSAQAIAVSLFSILAFATAKITARPKLINAAAMIPVLIVMLMVTAIAWSPLPASASAKGVVPYLKLLLIPLLFATALTERQVFHVLFSFVAGCAVVLVLSYSSFLLPSWVWLSAKGVGVPFKDNAVQSVCFALCAFGLGHSVQRLWLDGRRPLALGAAILALLFFANPFVISTSKTGLLGVVALVVLLLFHVSHTAKFKSIVAIAAVVVMVVGLAATFSHQMRDRLTDFHLNFVAAPSSTTADLSTALRLDYWKKGWQFVQEKSFLGFGSGTIQSLYQRQEATQPSPDGKATPDPHNQLLHIGLQTGLVGVTMLLVMWLVHLRLFFGFGFVRALGQAVILQAIIGCMFNSHLTTVTQGMIYCLAVGMLGSVMLNRATSNSANV